MKKILLILFVATFVLFAGAVMADDFNLTFAWEQPGEDLSHLDKWTLYMTGDGIQAQTIEIPYTGGAGPEFTAAQSFTVTGDPGAEVTRFFVLTAWSKNGNESEPSNQVQHVFEIPYLDVSPPASFSITAVVRVVTE